MKISTSFLSSRYIEEDLQKLNDTSTDYIHVDVMDGKFVKNKTLSFGDMKNIYKFTSKRLDVHLMVSKPKKYIEKYSLLNVEYLTIHTEIMENIDSLIDLIKSYGIKPGLSINPETSIEAVLPYLDKINLVLVMGVNPGKGGQPFIEEVSDKVIKLKKIIKEKNYNVLISVDGGITKDTKDLVKDADILVSGNYITSSDNFEEAINSLR